MKGTRISISVEGKPLFDRTFNRLVDQTQDLRPVWKPVNEWFENYIIRQYYGEGVGASGKWKPLTRRYEKWKEIKYPFMPIGRLTDKTFRSLKGKTAESVIDMQPRSFTRGTTTKQSKYFHEKRPVFDFTESDRVSLMKVIQRGFVPIVRRLNFIETELTERVG